MARQTKGAKIDTWTIKTPRKTTGRFDYQEVEVDLRLRYKKGSRDGTGATSEYVVDLEAFDWDKEFVGQTPEEVRVQVTEFLGRVSEVTDVEDVLIVTVRGFSINKERAQRGQLDGEHVHRVDTPPSGFMERKKRGDKPTYGTWKMGELKPEKKRESWEREDTIRAIIQDTKESRAAIDRIEQQVKLIETNFAKLFEQPRIETTLSRSKPILPMLEA